jgi:phage terminase large subunit-like protein
MTATARRLAELSPEQRKDLLADFSSGDLAALEWHWPFWARQDQLPPPGEWRTWLLLGGRGAGKTRSAAEWVRAEMESGRRRNMGIIGPTADAVRRIMVEGPSGILVFCP